MIALIPARSGSKRLPGKNTRILAGHPVLAYTICAARASGCFSRIYVSTDSVQVGQVADTYGVDDVRISSIGHQDADPDDVWLMECLGLWPPAYLETVALLRPTSPFRSADTIRRAVNAFSVPDGTHTSLRAVRPAREHPGKMWYWEGPGYPLTPVLKKAHPDGTPWHSSPTQSLPLVYVQTSSLEIFWASNLETYGSFAGPKVLPFLCPGPDGLSVDTPADWADAERLVATGAAQLPEVHLAGISTPAV